MVLRPYSRRLDPKSRVVQSGLKEYKYKVQEHWPVPVIIYDLLDFDSAAGAYFVSFFLLCLYWYCKLATQ